MTPEQNDLLRRALRGTALFFIAVGLMLFLPAWTLAYWQAWLFLVVFGLLCLVGTLYFVKHDPALVERRLASGPAAEQETSQKIIMTAASVVIVLLFIVPALDRRGAVAELVGIKGGVVSGVFNLESSGVEAPDWRPRHDKQYHEA